MVHNLTDLVQSEVDSVGSRKLIGCVMLGDLHQELTFFEEF